MHRAAHVCVNPDTILGRWGCYGYAALSTNADRSSEGSFMSDEIKLPDCMMDCYRALFPKLDFSRVAFFVGLPWPISSAGKGGFTMAPGGIPSPDIHVYVPSFDACDTETFVTIAHELVHVVQIQGMTGGGRIPGSWTAYYMSYYLGCCFCHGAGCSNALEKEAYDYANGCDPNKGELGKLRTFLEGSPTIHSQPPCDCSSLPPTPISLSGTQTYVEVLQSDPDLIVVSSQVTRTWCALLNWPVDLIVGAISVFGFINSGGFIGAVVGAIAAAAYFGFIGFLLGGPLGAAAGAIIGLIFGSLVGGAVGSAIGAIVGWIGSLF